MIPLLAISALGCPGPPAQWVSSNDLRHADGPQDPPAEAQLAGVPSQIQIQPTGQGIGQPARRTLGEKHPGVTRSGSPKNDHVNVDVEDADIRDVCRMLADAGGANLVIGDDVQGTVTVEMHDVPWDQAMSSILQSKGFVMERKGSQIVAHGSASTAPTTPSAAPTNPETP